MMDFIKKNGKTIITIIGVILTLVVIFFVFNMNNNSNKLIDNINTQYETLINRYNEVTEKQKEYNTQLDTKLEKIEANTESIKKVQLDELSEQEKQLLINKIIQELFLNDEN